MYTCICFSCATVDGHVVLESVQYRGQHVGVLPNGNIKEPGRTGTGHHAQFCLLVHKQPQVSHVGNKRHLFSLLSMSKRIGYSLSL